MKPSTCTFTSQRACSSVGEISPENAWATRTVMLVLCRTVRRAIDPQRAHRSGFRLASGPTAHSGRRERERAQEGHTGSRELDSVGLGGRNARCGVVLTVSGVSGV